MTYWMQFRKPHKAAFAWYRWRTVFPRILTTSYHIDHVVASLNRLIALAGGHPSAVVCESQ